MRRTAYERRSGPRAPITGGLRKLPVQERSRAMVEHVLQTATELVENLGYEAVVGSPTLLLEKAGVSRGSFYAFFESPERVLEELCHRQMQSSTEGLARALKDRPGERWTEIVDVLIDYYTQEHRTPLVRELWVRQNLTERVRTLDELCIEDWAGRVLEQFRQHAPAFDGLTQAHCSVALHALERLVQFAFTDDEDGDPAVLAQAHFMLTQFFAGHAGVSPSC
ncbi:TetR/AcrR family transcriptional regulator [Amycolatopsis tucumanensis]|uniref:HTH tetR-type domain-containing protein n=1 Tax=Amycolatopsis tucumanensis TaxID=401106 RepID=A0ABP7HEF7_9PSEU|nr:TetR/AcrR family transcriptional regulator [Amycolatopsis tucumanensis]MCF6421477.1 TetR/AcrR family transcriptional regulator [Amycolatopsis tucumanensis]